MLGFILRVLPFWIREPLLVVVGSAFGARIMYLAVHDQDPAAAGIGAVFLVFTAVRVTMMVRVLRARRNPAPAASTHGTAVSAAVQAPAGAGAPPSRAVPKKKEPNAWGQAAAAVGLFVVVAAVLWLSPHLLPSGDGAQQPASCSRGEHEALPKAYKETPRAVTGAELCEALNRPDLAQLLGTPGETATTASGTSDTAPLTEGRVAQPEAEVTFDTYTVDFSATYNELSTAQYVKLMKTGGEKDVEALTVLGRPAVFSSDHTMKIKISLGTGGSGGPVEQGPLARTLSVAFDPSDRGGYYDVTVWSASGALPDDSALVAIAEKVIPTLPARTAR
ncbi:hypothetical protein JS756_31585 [Streptomyces actuosus]|uniref:Tat pathway signal sequence domain protein n=1 Tax=Streptomyces actuosus TaxID=1885 RepID=A0ABS2VZW1_STRAS|nr:DUF6215 domain-containing protein [Streptomyces actuosus]MBN0048563.1 hypothetical protein [Streptomyces actuosus]